MGVCALIVAGGRGSRARREAQDCVPKQYVQLAGKAVLSRTISVFLSHPAVSHVQVVIHKDDVAAYKTAIARDIDVGNGVLLEPVFGGEDRQSSVRLGLEALRKIAPDRVLIHDAARPFVDFQTIDAVLSKVDLFDGAICALPVTDTLKAQGEDGLIKQTVDRSRLWRAQTPQGFHFNAIFEAHRKAFHEGIALFTDDASIAEWAGLKVALVEGSSLNIKLTTVEDLELADQRFEQQITSREIMNFEMRVGSGYDVHKFGPGDHLWICGVTIPHDKTLVGHSDADVGLHAITDAILGSIGAGDIGLHFPPSDPQWKGARSDVFLKHANDLVTKRGGRLINVDVTLICEEPKIGPFRAEMCDAIALMLGIEPERISVKATTSEKLGFTGRGEGMAAMACVSIRLPV